MKLHMGGKTYAATITPRAVIKAEELIEVFVKDGRSEAENIEDLAIYIADMLFQGRFTADEFLDTYESPTAKADMLGILGVVRGLVRDKLSEFPPSDAEGVGKNALRDSEKSP